MKQLEQYYRPDTELSQVVHELCDPALDFEKHRDQVNELVMNLVIKFIARYLKVDAKDPAKIAEATEVKKADNRLDSRKVLESLIRRQPVNSESLAIQSLTDVRATAAIVKEIIFDQKYTKTDFFLSTDCGSGTGILTLASAIAGKRREIPKILAIGFEINPTLVDDARRTLRDLVKGVQIEFGVGDLERQSSWQNFANQHLSQWISETIGHLVPPMTLEMEGPEPILYVNESEGDEYSEILNTGTDPFIRILELTTVGRPQFISDVRNKITAMFPDVINGDYKPDRMNSTLRLNTSPDKKHASLGEAGREFYQYQSLPISSTGSRRW